MSWQSLPTEIKQAIVDELEPVDAYPLATVDRLSYSACIGALFKSIKLNSPAVLASFLASVPASYLAQTASLSVDLAGSNNVNISPLLTLMPRLKTLSIASAGRLSPSILSVSLPHIRTLSLTNLDPHGLYPLSERLVVSFCSDLPSLTFLTLSGVVRSALHAPPTFFPVVTNDGNIPPHPTLNTDLALPNILRIASLQSLTIRDTPLSDVRWEHVPVACRITNVELDGTDADRVLARIGTSVQQVSLGVPAPLREPCPVLTKLHTTPFFPPEGLAPTFADPAFCSSPIARVDVECFADDLPDLCHAISDFLVIRKQSPKLWAKLERVDVRVLKGEETPCDEEALEAMARLIRLCTELKLRCDSVKALRRWPDGRLRANTV